MKCRYWASQAIIRFDLLLRIVVEREFDVVILQTAAIADVRVELLRSFFAAESERLSFDISAEEDLGKRVFQRKYVNLSDGIPVQTKI